MGLIPLEQLQSIDPIRYEQLIKSTQQTNATLNQTNAAAGAESASAANTAQTMQINQQKLSQQQFIKEAQTLFDKSKNKDGYVDPQLFNTTKQAATKIGIDSASFDSSFGDKSGYVDPNKVIYYNSQDGLANQQAYGLTKRLIQSQLDQYNSIPPQEKGVLSTGYFDKIPFLSQILAPHASAYEQARTGLSAQLKSIAGGGAGSGLRVTQAELDRWANLLPGVTESPTTITGKLNQIDKGLKAQFNIPTGLDPAYLSSKGRPPLSSFGQ